MARIEDNPKLAAQNLKEFDEQDLRQLAKAGITPYHLAGFLDSLRNNVNPRYPQEHDEIQAPEESCCAFV
ncbi:MAG: hypothetical protein L0Y78_03490 [candidate division NC10 bacterium]|nr:hypothetical protein [candidate division NC10 bacterium]